MIAAAMDRFPSTYTSNHEIVCTISFIAETHH